jgi:hypothetical protein
VLSTFVDTLETCHAFKIKITYTPLKYVTSTLEVRNIMFLSIHPITPMPPNKCSKFLLLSLKSFVTERGLWLCKSYSKKEKKEKKRVLKKWTSVHNIKTMGTSMPA